jgi:hypothetical protein
MAPLCTVIKKKVKKNIRKIGLQHPLYYTSCTVYRGETAELPYCEAQEPSPASSFRPLVDTMQRKEVGVGGGGGVPKQAYLFTLLWSDNY